MPQVKRSALVEYSAAQMYALVADISKYPEFLAWCSSAEIVARGDDYVVATLGIAFKGLKQQFTTRNELHENERIDMKLVEGPFSHLNGRWLFKDLAPGGSKIALDMSFTLSISVLARVASPVFAHIADSQVDAFHKRARQLHG